MVIRRAVRPIILLPALFLYACRFAVYIFEDCVSVSRTIRQERTTLAQIKVSTGCIFPSLPACGYLLLVSNFFYAMISTSFSSVFLYRSCQAMKNLLVIPAHPPSILHPTPRPYSPIHTLTSTLHPTPRPYSPIHTLTSNRL